MSLFTKIFGTHSEREIKRIMPMVEKIEALSDEYKKLTDEQLKAKTDEFKSRLNSGETEDDILCEAFATVREASDRVLGKRHYKVQLIGGIVIHQGRIAEMKTGEGKTLVSTLPPTPTTGSTTVRLLRMQSTPTPVPTAMRRA